VKRADRDYVAASAAGYLLGGRGQGFRLFDAMVTKGGLTGAVTLSLTATVHAAWFAGNLTTRPDQTEAAIAALERELKRLAEEGPTADELGRVQGDLVDSFLGRFDSLPGVAVELVNEFAAGLATDYPEKYVEQVASLTADDVKRAAQRMFAGGLVIFTVGPPQAAP
jgi:zinc protease